MDAWNNFTKYLFQDEHLGLTIDFSKIGFDDAFFQKMRGKIEGAYKEMAALEAGAIANIDEHRMVGHYWLRNPSIAPTPEIEAEIRDAISKVVKFAESVHMGDIRGQMSNFKNVLFVGIGGSALGPQLACHSLAGDDKLNCFFIDNTDPDGMNFVLKRLDGELDQTLVVVTSKSGSTPEPRNAMMAVRAAYENANFIFARHAVAITKAGSLLDECAKKEGWLARFPMWDWVGGRTSICSVVGLLPMALQGHSVKKFLDGARDIDTLTRQINDKNPAMLMALAWYLAGNGVGSRDMVVIPYKDRLCDLSKYLQQLIMESLGKEKDRNGNIVNQGLTVYGNKGSTDQHSFIQQLRDGLQNFFITIVTVLRSDVQQTVEVDDLNMTPGDYLNGFAIGTMQALAERHVPIIHLTINKFSEYELGVLIGLYERAVGFYASMLNINAYHQPGVEAGKKAAFEVLKLQKKMLNFLQSHKGQKFSVIDICQSMLYSGEPSLIFKLLEFLSANGHIVKSIERGDCIYGVM